MKKSALGLLALLLSYPVIGAEIKTMSVFVTHEQGSALLAAMISVISMSLIRQIFCSSPILVSYRAMRMRLT